MSDGICKHGFLWCHICDPKILGMAGTLSAARDERDELKATIKEQAARDIITRLIP